MIPAFLEKYRPEIEAYRLDTIRISAQPLKRGESSGITQSKFLGRPFVPKDKSYPRAADGTPLIMLAQINFAEVPPLEDYPTTGILQLFVHPTEWYNMEAGDYKIIFHESDKEEHLTDFGFLTSDLYADSPVSCEHSLAFAKETEYGGTEDFRFQLTFDGLDYYPFQQKLPKEQQDQMDKLFYVTGHKIGGYAYFTQSDPRDYDEKSKDDVLLLQIDSDKKIMFGDSGVGNVFINIDDLRKRNFDRAYFYWDCC